MVRKSVPHMRKLSGVAQILISETMNAVNTLESELVGDFRRRMELKYGYRVIRELRRWSNAVRAI